MHTIVCISTRERQLVQEIVSQSLDVSRHTVRW